MCYNTRGRTSCSSLPTRASGATQTLSLFFLAHLLDTKVFFLCQEFLLGPGSQPRRIIWSHEPLADPLFSAQSSALSLASKLNYNNFCLFYLKIHLLKYTTHSRVCVCLCVFLSFPPCLLHSPFTALPTAIQLVSPLFLSRPSLSVLPTLAQYGWYLRT